MPRGQGMTRDLEARRDRIPPIVRTDLLHTAHRPEDAPRLMRPQMIIAHFKRPGAKVQGSIF